VDSLWVDETPYDLLIIADQKDMIDNLLDRLGHRYREVLVLRVYEELSYAEIARVTGDTESSVRSRIFKARKALAEKVKQFST
jgi:RNA polymerase sigma-70 factor (ECF subfamily)